MEHRPTDERKVQIVEALLEVMAEHGYAKATIAKVADAAGLTPGLLHYHFKSKQQMLLALLEKLVDDELAALDELDRAPADALVTLVDRLLATGESARPNAVAAWVTIGAEAIRQPEVRTRYDAALRRLAKLVTAVVERGVDEQRFEPDRPIDEVVAAFLALVQGYYNLAATARDLIPASSAAPAARTLLFTMLQTEVP